MAWEGVEIWCLRYPQRIDRSFPIRIIKQTSISQLKEEISKQCPYWPGRDVAHRPRDLALWKLDPPIPDGDEKSLSAIAHAIGLIQRSSSPINHSHPPGATKLKQNTAHVGDVFPSLPAYHLHIIVFTPNAVQLNETIEGLSIGHPLSSPGTTMRKAEKIAKEPERQVISISDTILKFAPTTPSDVNAVLLPLHMSNIHHWQQIGNIYIDKSSYISQIEATYTETFRVILLRPKGFGKSAFLALLVSYYDLKQKKDFNRNFQSTYISKSPTASRSSHFVLNFDLSMVDFHRDHIESSFNKYINFKLRLFLTTYSADLGLSNSQLEEALLHTIDTSNASKSFADILDLVSRSDYTLFVAVDEYDFPLRGFIFKSSKLGSEYEHISHAEAFMKQRFFAILKGGCGLYDPKKPAPIAKLWLTGVLPCFRDAESPLEMAHVITDNAIFEGVCGFNNEEVRDLIRHYLNLRNEKEQLIVDLHLYTMERYYSGHRFANSSHNLKSQDPNNGIYHPLLVLHYLIAYKSNGIVRLPSGSVGVHLAQVLGKITGQELDLLNIIQDPYYHDHLVSQLFDVRSNDFEGIETSSNTDIIVALLYYFGLFTLADSHRSRIKIPNDVAKSFIHRYTAPIDNCLCHPLDSSIQKDGATQVVQSFEMFLQDRPLSVQAGSRAGNVFRQMAESMLIPSCEVISQVCLVANSMSGREHGKFAFVDLLILPRDPKFGNALVIQFQNCHLPGLYQTNRVRSETMDLLDELENVEETELRNLKFEYIDDSTKRKLTERVEDYMIKGKDRMEEYLEILRAGRVDSYDGTGVLDGRLDIRTDTGGQVGLTGLLLCVVGGVRVLHDIIPRIQTNLEISLASWERYAVKR